MIFVSGLGHNYMDSWEGPQKTLWPRELLPKEFPDSRILLFQYVTNVGGEYDTSVLFAELLAFRLKDASTMDRPIIFAGNGLGGLTIQRVPTSELSSFYQPFTFSIPS